MPNTEGSDLDKRPVIIFFHPGGFYSFSGQSSVFGPQYFLDQDIILVTVNYRLMTFGKFEINKFLNKIKLYIV